MPNNTNAGQDRCIELAENLSETVSTTISGLISIIEDLDTEIGERDKTIKSLTNTINDLNAEIESLKENQ